MKTLSPRLQKQRCTRLSLYSPWLQWRRVQMTAKVLQQERGAHPKQRRVQVRCVCLCVRARMAPFAATHQLSVHSKGLAKTNVMASNVMPYVRAIATCSMCPHNCKHRHMRTCNSTYTHTHRSAQPHNTCTYTRTRTHTHTHTNAHKHTYAHTHTCTHTHTHTHTHTRTNTGGAAAGGLEGTADGTSNPNATGASTPGAGLQSQSSQPAPPPPVQQQQQQRAVAKGPRGAAFLAAGGGQQGGGTAAQSPKP
eukprot:scaffold237186_cov24-Tisochrysis_lutea.AAC.1